MFFIGCSKTWLNPGVNFGTWKTAADWTVCNWSSNRAESSTDRVRAKLIEAPCQDRQSLGPVGTRPRVGFKPINPDQLEGIRIEPPPSFPAANGTQPAATAAADPPEEPPGVTAVFHGFRAGPKSFASVIFFQPNSGKLVWPIIMKPACCKAWTKLLVAWATLFWNNLFPLVSGSPANCCPNPLIRMGTPKNGCPWSVNWRASFKADFSRRWITAFSCGFSALTFSIAALTNSKLLTFFALTKSANW